MKILKPDITVYWDKGITMKVHSFLYVDPAFKVKHRGQDADLSIRVNISGTDTPTVVVTGAQGYNYGEGMSDKLLKLIPGAMETVDSWMDHFGLLDTWRQELADYNSVMQSVDLPGATFKGGERSASYTLPIKPENISGGLSADGECNLPALEVIVRVGKDGAMVQLQIDTGETDDDWEKIMCTICYCDLELPITMDSLKASICKPFQQYLNCIQTFTGP